MGDLSDLFLSCHAEPIEAEAPLEEALAARVAAGRSAWPGIALDDALFVRHLAAHAEGARLPPLEHAADLWLACACAHGVRGAASELGRVHRDVIERTVRRIDRALVDDVTQSVLTMLLVAEPPARPRVAQYKGHAPLGAWLARIAAREAVHQKKARDGKPQESISRLGDAATRAEPELVVAKARYAPEFDASLRDALKTLDARQRVLLRLHHVEGWSMDRLAVLYKVGRSTCARWVEAARDALLDATKAALRERVTLTTSELDSLVGALQADCEVSLIRLLKDEPVP